MKKVVLSSIVYMLSSGLAVAGGDIVPVEPVVPAVQVLEHDNSGWYAGAALYYSRVYSVDSGWFDDTPTSQDEIGELTGIIGYEYNEYLAFEARGSFTFAKEDYADAYNYSFLVKPQYRFRDEEKYEDDYFTLYGLLGFGYVNVEGTDGNAPAAPTTIGKTLVDDWQFQYGIGFSYTIVDNEHPENNEGDWTIFFEYMMHMDDESMTPTQLYYYDPEFYDKLSMDSINMGVIYHF